jgi:hypothetical protein
MSNDHSASGFYAFVSKRFNKFYASFAPLNGGVVLGVAILGPCKTEREAQDVVDKWTRLNKKRMNAGEALHFVDTKSVPADVRAFITNDVTTAIKQGVINPDTRQNSIFGRPLQ